MKVLDPKTAVKDEGKLSSDSVKKSLEAIKNYRAATKDISDMLVMEAGDPSRWKRLRRGMG